MVEDPITALVGKMGMLERVVFATHDDFGRTTVPGVYAAGDASVVIPSQLIIAAASGSRAAAGVNTDLIHSEFL